MPVPWNQIIQWAPQILTLSRELLQRARRPRSGEQRLRAANPDDVAARVAALEENERRQAELLERMAAQQAELSRAVFSLHRQQRWLMAALMLLTAVAVWLALR